MMSWLWSMLLKTCAIYYRVIRPFLFTSCSLKKSQVVFSMVSGSGQTTRLTRKNNNTHFLKKDSLLDIYLIDLQKRTQIYEVATVAETCLLSLLHQSSKFLSQKIENFTIQDELLNCFMLFLLILNHQTDAYIVRRSHKQFQFNPMMMAQNPNPLHIIVYGTQSCPFTQQVTQYLIGHGKAFTFVDTATPQGLEAFNTNVKSKMTHHHDSIPLIYVDGACLGGYKEFMKKAEKGTLKL